MSFLRIIVEMKINEVELKCYNNIGILLFDSIDITILIELYFRM